MQKDVSYSLHPRVTFAIQTTLDENLTCYKQKYKKKQRI